MTRPPEIKAQRPERTPSVWSPRPVPTPGVGRRTADPRTPTLRELAEREAQRASLTEAAAATTWVGVHVLTLDGMPVAGGDYDVRASDGQAHGGITDGQGHGRVASLAPGECTVWAGGVALSPAAGDCADEALWPPITGGGDADAPADDAMADGNSAVGGSGGGSGGAPDDLGGRAALRSLSLAGADDMGDAAAPGSTVAGAGSYAGDSEEG